MVAIVAVLVILLLFILFFYSKQDLKKIYIISNDKKYEFNTKIVTSSDDIMKGLMGVKWIPKNYGMYFQFAVPQQASFWMKDTLIPLDILFINNRRIVSIETGVPMSEKKILSPGMVTGALEIRGGLAAELGILQGSTILD